MSHSLYSNLLWLPEAPEDFSLQCKNALTFPEDLGKRIQYLASHRLNENQLNKLASLIKKASQQNLSLAPLTPVRLGVISNATTHHIIPALIASAGRHGIALSCVEADYGQEMQEALSPNSQINKAELDAVLVAIDYHGLPLKITPGDERSAQETMAAVLSHLETIRAGLHASSKAVCIMQTLPMPLVQSFGSFDRTLPGTYASLIDGVNNDLAKRLAGSADILFDVAGLADTVGLAEWHDLTQWNMAKLPFASKYLPLYAEHVCRLIAALRGKSRRCLILDLDNTVWGGVIGDDGLEGIILGQGDATGEAHLEVQKTALMLRDRGIVLAVSSKNDDQIARTPFQKHPEMLLRENHIAVFQANWNDKATNIKAIAEELSLGLDAMVFLDDNPVERNLVRRMLPQVAVPELPLDPALYARTLLAGGYFEAVTFSNEDRNRAQFYQENAQRVALQKKAGNLDEYLASLKMVMTVQPFDETGRTRITQLINKSNQFNLTTRRYTEADIRNIEHDPNCFTLQVRLADMFSDNGMISVVIAKRVGSDLDIDTWLMSCRVLSRKVENAVLVELISYAKEIGAKRLLGTYIPTERNKLVENHYANLGFTEVSRAKDGTTRWELNTTEAPAQILPMEIQRNWPLKVAV